VCGERFLLSSFVVVVTGGSEWSVSVVEKIEQDRVGRMVVAVVLARRKATNLPLSTKCTTAVKKVTVGSIFSLFDCRPFTRCSVYVRVGWEGKPRHPFLFRVDNTAVARPDCLLRKNTIPTTPSAESSESCRLIDDFGLNILTCSPHKIDFMCIRKTRNVKMAVDNFKTTTSPHMLDLIVPKTQKC
jgi:hypothetical protein